MRCLSLPPVFPSQQAQLLDGWLKASCPLSTLMRPQ